MFVMLTLNLSKNRTFRHTTESHTYTKQVKCAKQFLLGSLVCSRIVSSPTIGYKVVTSSRFLEAVVGWSSGSNSVSGYTGICRRVARGRKVGSGGGGGFNFWEVLGASIPRPFRRPRAEEQGKVPTRNGSVVVRSLAVRLAPATSPVGCCADGWP